MTGLLGMPFMNHPKFRGPPARLLSLGLVVAAAVCSFPAAATNFALNQVATGSSACSTNETPAKAVNGSVVQGNPDKFCSGASTRYLQVDLGTSRTFSYFVVKSAGAGGEDPVYNTRDYNIQVSNTGRSNSWTTVATVSGNTANVTTTQIAPTTARYVKLNIVDGEQGAGTAARIYEFEVDDVLPPPEQTLSVFDQIPQYGIYRSTDPAYTPPPGVLMWNHGTEYARKLTSTEKAQLGDDLALRITYHGQCDEYDRFASIFYISMPVGQAPVSTTPRVTLVDYISPFSNAWQGAYSNRTYPNQSIWPYLDALTDPNRDVWVGISGGSNPQYGNDACQQRGITDPAIAEVGFKYSLSLVWSQARGTAGDRDVISLLSRSEERDDNITTSPVNTTSQLDLATLAISIAGYGADSGGQEYAKANISIYRNGALLTTFNDGVDCAQYAVYSPRGNQGIFANNTTTNPRSWCPGALIQTRYYDLGAVNGTSQNISVTVGNPSPWTAQSLYRTSLSIIEH